MAALLVDASERFLGEALARLDAAGFGGLTVSHAFAIQLIEAGVSTNTALSHAMRMTPQAVSAIVDQLLAGGFVAKHRGPSDARARLLTLTEEGRRLAAAIAKALADAERVWIDLVGRQPLREVRAALETYVADGSQAGPDQPRRGQRRVRFV